MLAQIAHLNIGAEECGRCPREQHLAAVASGADPRPSVDIDPDVALGGNHGFARVDAHSHAYRATRERALHTLRRRDSVGSVRERGEERIALRIDLDATVFRQG